MSGTSIFNELSMIDLKDTKLVEPALIQQGQGTSAKFFKLNKYAEEYIYAGLEIKPKQSRDLFKIEPSMWRDYIDKLQEKKKFEKATDEDSRAFTIDDCKGVLFRDTVIDVYRNDFFDSFKFESFISDVIKFERKGELTATFNEFNILNMVYKREKGVIAVSLNFDKGKHEAYSGMLLDNETIILSPKPIMESRSLSEFMILFMPEQQLNDSSIIAEHNSSINYKTDVPLSLREILDVIKITKCKVETDDEGYAASLTGFTTKNSSVIVDFLMSFNCPYKTLKTLSALRKSFKTGKITSGMMLKILTKELESDAINVTADLIAKVSDTCDTDEFDKTVIEEETSGAEIEW